MAYFDQSKKCKKYRYAFLWLFYESASTGTRMFIVTSVSDPHSLYAYQDLIPDPDPNLGLKLGYFFQNEIQFHVFIK
jgi:hypothetical protein